MFLSVLFVNVYKKLSVQPEKFEHPLMDTLRVLTGLMIVSLTLW